MLKCYGSSNTRLKAAQTLNTTYCINNKRQPAVTLRRTCNLRKNTISSSVVAGCELDLPELLGKTVAICAHDNGAPLRVDRQTSGDLLEGHSRCRIRKDLTARHGKFFARRRRSTESQLTQCLFPLPSYLAPQ